MSHDYYKAVIIKFLFIVLKHVGFYVKDKFDFENAGDLSKLKDIVIHAYRMKFNPEYRWSEHPNLSINELVAVILYRLKVPYGSTLFIDDVTVNYGYGFCTNVGTFPFEIPHRFMVKGTVIESCPVFQCELETRIESIDLHAYRNVKE